MQRLPQTTQLLYAELLQQCAVALPNQRGISFVPKTVSGHRYWYMELVAGSTKRQFSLGRDSEALRTQIERQKALFAEAAPDLKQRAQEFHVDLLTPSQGPETGKSVYLPHFNSYAHPMRFLEYLLEDCQDAVIPFRSGIFVNVPNPARFALHKLVVSQRRPVAQQIKARKDIQQATELLGVLLEDRPGDIWIANEYRWRCRKRINSDQCPFSLRQISAARARCQDGNRTTHRCSGKQLGDCLRRSRSRNYRA
jgi:hypothetical protein